MRAVMTHLWIAAAAAGLAFVGLGILFVVMGFDAKATIRAAMAEENVTTSKESVEFGVPAGLLVQDAKTAEAQANVIKMHSIDRYGLYTEMERDDPNRATYVTGLTLRNSLNLAVMGFGVADLAIGTGAIVLLMGVATLVVGVPALYGMTAAEESLVALRRRTTEVPAAGD